MESSKPTGSNTPLLSPVLRLFLLTMILANVAGAMYVGFIPLYLKSLGANVGQIGLFFTVAQIIPLVLQILGGWISDSLGRLKSIAYGSVSGVVSYIALILAPTWAWVLVGESLNAVTRSLVGRFWGFCGEELRGKQGRVTELWIPFIPSSLSWPPVGDFWWTDMDQSHVDCCRVTVYSCNDFKSVYGKKSSTSASEKKVRSQATPGE